MDIIFNFFKFIFVACIFSSCTNLFYQPSSVEFTSPHVIKDFDVEEFFIQSEDQTHLRVWSVHKKGQKNNFKGIIAQFHGNAQNVTTHVGLVSWLSQYGYEVLTFDYRGYGKSEKTAEHKGVRQDGAAFLKFALERAKKQNMPLFVYGQSLGGAIALRAIEDTENTEALSSIVIEGGFASYKRVGKTVLSKVWFLYPFAWLSYGLVSDEDAPKKFLKKRKDIPLLVIHSIKDPVVKFKNGKQIFDQARGEKCFWEILEPGHVNLMFVGEKKYREGLKKFLEVGACN